MPQATACDVLPVRVCTCDHVELPVACSATSVQPDPLVIGFESSQFWMAQPATTQLSLAGAADRSIEKVVSDVVPCCPVAVAPIGDASCPVISNTCSIVPSDDAPEFEAETVVDDPVATGAVQMVTKVRSFPNQS